MSHPHSKDDVCPEDFGQHKTLFVQGGRKTAALVENLNGKRTSQAMQFGDPHAALDWCMGHEAVMVYMPKRVGAN